MDISSIIIASISLVGTLVGTFAGIITGTKLINYRIEQLEKKVEKHNSVIERTALVERDIAGILRVIDEIKAEVHETHS